MKRPSLKRKQAPTPQQQAAATRPERKRRFRGAAKAPTPQQQADGPKPAGKRRLRGAAMRPLRLLGRPFAKIRSLQGRARIIVWGLLAAIVVVALLSVRGGRDDEVLVRESLTRYEKASRDKDYQTLCDDLLAASYVRQTASSGLPCEVALRTALEDVRNPTLDVLSVEVNGDRALARVRGAAAGQVPGEANYTLVREDDAWRILPPRASAQAP